MLREASLSARRVSSARVTDVVIAADHAALQPAGTTITWMATPSGGTAPYQYKWLLYNGSDWDVLQNWSASKTLRWTPAFANTRYRIAVWVRSFGNISDACEASTEAAFAIEAPASPLWPVSDNTAPTSPRLPPALSEVSTVTLFCDCASPQPAGTSITWTAIVTGGETGRQFKWFVYDGSSWTVASPWSPQATFSWTPAMPNPRYRIAVWVRTTGNTRDYFEASADAGFPIIEP